MRKEVVKDLRAGKVSMRANCGNLFPGSCAVMRTRPRLNGYAAKWGARSEAPPAGKVSMRANCRNLFPGSCAVIRTRPRLSGYAAKWGARSEAPPARKKESQKSL